MPAFEIQPGKQHLSKAPGSTLPLPLPGEKTLQAFSQAAITSSTFHVLQITRHSLTHCTIKTPNQNKQWEKNDGVRRSRDQVMEEGRPAGGWATRIKDVRINAYGSAHTAAGPCSTSSNTSFLHLCHQLQNISSRWERSSHLSGRFLPLTSLSPFSLGERTGPQAGHCSW